MAKLHFRYGAMNSGKTTILIQTAYNYEERDQNVIIIKPSADTKGNKNIVSRIGATRMVDYLITEKDKILEVLNSKINQIDCILVDEVQFLNKNQIDELFYITKIFNIPVIAFGLRTDFKTNGFEGSIRLLELADSLEEMPTICRCGKKARFNGRKINGKFINDGETVLIDGEVDNIEYESLCGECYIKKVVKKEKAG